MTEPVFKPTPVRHLRAELAGHIGGEETLVGAFLTSTGLRASELEYQFPDVGLVLSVLRGCFGRRESRWAVAVTDQAVYVFRTGRWRLKPRFHHRFAGHGALGELSGTAECSLPINSVKHWVPLYWSDEARRILRLIK